MADESTNDGSSPGPPASRTRKIRPEIQIYRPGMMRKGTDVTASGPPPSDCKPPTEPSSHKRSPRISLDLGGARKFNENSRRRRSDDTESVHSYHGDSGSTTPDAASMCSDRRDSFGKVSGSRTFSRGGYSGNRQVYHAGRNDNTNSTFSPKKSSREYNNRQNSRTPLTQGNRDCSSTERTSGSRYSYNSTQSLYDPQQPGSYLSNQPHFNRRRGKQEQGRAPSPMRFRRTAQLQQYERASMRAEAGQRRNVGNRRRNDSINSTQSEYLPQYSDHLRVDTHLETQSVSGDAPSSSSMSYMQLCQSFESIGSFDWSQEVESEYNAKHSDDQEENNERTRERFENRVPLTDSSINKFSHGDYSSSKPRRGILRVPISVRHGHERDRHDSDRSSSLRGSIVEENYEVDDISSGDATPTEESGDEKHWNRQKELPLTNARDAQCKPGYSGNLYQEQDKPSRLAGRLTVIRPKTAPQTTETSSLSPQVAPVTRRTETIRTYKPPAMRASEKYDAIKANADVRNSVADEKMRAVSTSQHNAQPRQMTDYPVYHEIASNEGPKMQKINDSISSLLSQVQKRDVRAAEKVVQLSDELAEIYYGVLTRDIFFTFSMNLEQHLWKQAFYKPIEVFKSVVNSPKESSKTFRNLLLILLNKGITFYGCLIDLYEKELGVDMEKAIIVPSILHENDFWSVSSSLGSSQNDSTKLKVAIKSCSRHLISLGDLKRYKTLVEGSEDYRDAKMTYLRSALFWPSSGHCYNQLAVVAYFSMLYRSRRRARNTPLEILSNRRQGQALDEIFFCVRALSADHPFEAARDRLYARLAAMKRKVDKYEPLLDAECGEVREDAELAASADRPYEIWLDMEGPNIETENDDAHIFRSFLEQQPSKLHRRTISYVISTVGLLITKIGMESFPSVSERAIGQLTALVEQDCSPVTANQLIQIASLFIYAVHCNGIVGDADVCSLQQQHAVRALVSVFGAYLRPIVIRLEEIGSWIQGTSTVPSVVSRVLPALCVLCEWFSCPLASAIYRTMPSVEALPLSIVDIDTWDFLAKIGNELMKWQDNEMLAKIENGEGSNKSFILPELAYMSSFSEVFPPFPRILHCTVPLTDSMEHLIPLHVRLAQLLLAVEYLDGSELSCFFFCEKTGKFTRSEHIDGEHKEGTSTSSDSHYENSQSSSSPPTREELLERELRKHEQLLVVKPLYVVIDTNAFIDQLEKIQKIQQCERFRILIPTTVMEELMELQHGEINSTHAEAATAGARQAMSWLREQTRQKSPRMFTLTMRGRRVPIAVVREESADDREMVNDDRILRSCVNFTELEPAQEANFADFKQSTQTRNTPIIYRNVILLTDDRVLNMKAMSQHIPCRTLIRFMKWAKIS
ncbi:hypothetical protein RB195_011817 [Necator americanus]|uniref:PIN domain-containing protein n=1 Tax=Necator americanus TaxID=51031 RepID=A0ABR1D637_NECAM